MEVQVTETANTGNKEALKILTKGSTKASKLSIANHSPLFSDNQSAFRRRKIHRLFFISTILFSSAHLPYDSVFISDYLMFSFSLLIFMGICFAKKHRDDEDEEDHHVELAGGNVHLITTKESWEQKLAEARTESKTVIANFSASWCGPCRVIAPFYSELSEKYPSLMFLTVDVDELTEFSSSWDIKATPTFFFLKGGEQIDKLVGANKPELQKKLVDLVDSEAGKR